MPFHLSKDVEKERGRAVDHPGRVFTGSTWPVGGARPSLNRNTSVVLDAGGWKEAAMGDRAGPPLSSRCLSAPLGVCFSAGRGQGSGW